MSLGDKLSLWDANIHVREKDNVSICDVDELDADDLYEADMLNLRGYRKILSTTSAYRWLLSSIRVKSTLQVPGPGVVANQIGDQIVKAADKGTVSRKHTRELQMLFVVDWNPFLFLREQGYDYPPSYVLAHAITLTGHGSNLQAATTEDYMKQTWPETGPQVLALLQQAIQGEPGADKASATTVLPDKTTTGRFVY